jgi:hypothetical protein
MKIEIEIVPDKLVTKYGEVPFNPALKCPVCGTQMKLRRMEDYTDSSDGYEFHYECTTCGCETKVELQ